MKLLISVYFSFLTGCNAAAENSFTVETKLDEILFQGARNGLQSGTVDHQSHGWHIRQPVGPPAFQDHGHPLVGFVVDDHQLHAGVEQLTRVADIDSRRLFVSSQHPHVNVSIQQSSNSPRYLQIAKV